MRNKPQSWTTQRGAISTDVEAEASKQESSLARVKYSLVTWMPNDPEYPRKLIDTV